MRLVSDVQQGFQMKPADRTVLASLDLSSAFNKVEHLHLLDLFPTLVSHLCTPGSTVDSCLIGFFVSDVEIATADGLENHEEVYKAQSRHPYCSSFTSRVYNVLLIQPFKLESTNRHVCR